LQLHFVENEQVVKAFLSHASQKAFADRIGSGRVVLQNTMNRKKCCAFSLGS
jgi:hypothetical protein